MRPFAAVPTLLTRDESSAIKGVLILMIVLGHNSLIVKNVLGGERLFLFCWLYSFHVYCFYILPFLYGIEINRESHLGRLIIQRYWKNLCRFYPLFLAMAAGCIIISCLMGEITFSWFGVLRTLIVGEQNLLYTYVGFGFLWFLPAICAVMLWRDIYFLGNPIVKTALLLASLLMWVGQWSGWINLVAWESWIPLAICQGLYYSSLGLLCRYGLTCKYRNEIGAIAVALFLLLPCFVFYRAGFPDFCRGLSWFIGPITAMISLFVCRNWLKGSRLLKILGHYSLQIYLLHIFIFNILKHIFPDNLVSGVVIYFFTVTLSLLLALGLARTAYVGKLVFR